MNPAIIINSLCVGLLGWRMYSCNRDKRFGWFYLYTALCGIVLGQLISEVVK